VGRLRGRGSWRATLALPLPGAILRPAGPTPTNVDESAWERRELRGARRPPVVRVEPGRRRLRVDGLVLAATRQVA
jgi:hypothetical protein